MMRERKTELKSSVLQLSKSFFLPFLLFVERNGGPVIILQILEISSASLGRWRYSLVALGNIYLSETSLSTFGRLCC